MEIRDSYKREFLISLRDSPAWDLFIKQMLSCMHFIQDDVKFKMNGLAYKTYLLDEYFPDNKGISELRKGEIYRILIDNVSNRIRFSDGLISNDGLTWKLDEVVNNSFYILPDKDVLLKDTFLQVVDFFPNHLSCNDMRQLLSVFGIFNPDVTYSSFDTIFSATSPYLLHYVLVRGGVPYRKNYIFLDEAQVEMEGSTTETVRESIFLKRAYLNQFYYKSDLTLIPGKDFIVFNGGEYPIYSVNKNTLTSNINAAEGKFDIKRYDYLVPLAPDLYLTSALELEFGDIDIDTAYRIIDRVTPVRCSQGFKGKINVRIYSNLDITSEGLNFRTNKRTLVNLIDEISFLENQVLYNGPRPVRENGIQLMDLGYTDTVYEQIILE